MHPQHSQRRNPWSPVPALLQRRRSQQAQPAASDDAQKILLPVDVTGAFRAALEHVIALSRTLPIRVYLVNVQPASHAGASVRAIRARWSEAHHHALNVLRWAKGALTAQGIDCQVEMVFGAPAEEIVRNAAAHGCDKIVMTRRPRGFLRALVTPSVSQRVMKRSPLPVTVVQPLPSAEQMVEPFRPLGLKDLVQARP